MSRRALFPTTRTGTWIVLAGWLVVLVVGGLVAGRLTEVQRNDTESFLPAAAESVQVIELQQQAGSDALPAVVVYERAGGLTAADLAAVAADAARLPALVEVDPAVSPPIPSQDGQSVQLVVPLGADDGFRLGADVQALRTAVGSSVDGGARDDGLRVWVTGPGGLQGDFLDVFDSIDGVLLLATGLIVALVLLVTYRSPLLVLVPLVAVGAAELSARALVVLLADAGLVVNGQSASILSVLVFGAGTDYALLLVSRYREELRLHEDRHAAMAVALRQAGPAVLASGGTVVAGMLCLLVADDQAVRGLGPVAAVGILTAMAAMLTFLPALLVLIGRPAFWPFVPRAGTPHDETATAWGRLGGRISRRPRAVWLTTAAVLGGLWLGLTTLDAGGLANDEQFRAEAESITGQEVLARHYPVGSATPLNVVGRGVDQAAVEAVLRDDPGVSEVVTTAPAAGGVVQVDAVLADAPDSKAAAKTVERLRAALDEVDPNVLVGGSTALNLDIQRIAQRDRTVIIPLVLLVVLAIIVALLRSLVAPLLLLATTVLSFGAALGLSALVFQYLLGIDAADSSFPLFAFIFLVALGIDYNIFLMTRVREETARVGSSAGMLRGLAVTGGVITSAGVVLASTFAVLGVLPLTFLTQLGVAVALGVLLDALVVRSVLVPALVLDVGPRVWWPSRLARQEQPAVPFGEQPVTSR